MTLILPLTMRHRLYFLQKEATLKPQAPSETCDGLITIEVFPQQVTSSRWGFVFWSFWGLVPAACWPRKCPFHLTFSGGKCKRLSALTFVQKVTRGQWSTWRLHGGQAGFWGLRGQPTFLRVKKPEEASFLELDRWVYLKLMFASF